MRIYWSIHSIPELAEFPRDQRERIVKEATYGKVEGTRRFLFGMAVAFFDLILFAAMVPLVIPLWNLFSLTPNIGGVVTGLCILGPILALGVIASNHFKIAAMVPFVREFLRHYCVSCGYDLTGNESGVCPECGKAFPLGRLKWLESRKQTPTA